jgi:N-acetylmuramoyl-L-alanine amidase
MGLVIRTDSKRINALVIAGVALALLLVWSSNASASASISLQDKKGKAVTVRSIDTAAIDYICLNDIANALSYEEVYYQSSKKLELTMTSHRIKVTHSNPFVVMTALSSGRMFVLQLSHFIIGRNNLFFIPAQEFVTLYNRLEPDSIQFDRAHRSFRFSPKIIAKDTSQFDITGLTFRRFENGALITIKANQRVGDIEHSLNQDGWLYITITNATMDTIALQAFDVKPPILKALPIQYPGSVQLTFKLAKTVYRAEISRDTASYNLFLSLFERAAPEPQKQKEPSPPQRSVEATLEHQRDRWGLDVVVIDPGHGGKDPGTIGCRGTYEKDVVLPIGLKLGERIHKTWKDVTVVYTRSTDEFVELYRRTQLANGASGKLFISLHCNSMPKKPHKQNGFEIYLLRPGKTEDALEVAARENEVVRFEENYKERYKNMTEESFIIAAMAQNSFVRYSERFAELAAGEMGKGMKIASGGVKQAGFYVLVGASMPNVLIETGYLSNKKDEAYLKSKTGQTAMAESIFRAIKLYKEEYEKSLATE